MKIIERKQSYQTVAADTELKLKIRDSELLENVNDTEIKKFQGEPLAGKKIGIMKDLKCIPKAGTVYSALLFIFTVTLLNF